VNADDLFRIQFIDWTWTYFARSRGLQVPDRTDADRINWQDYTEDCGDTTAQ
jgi:hypothetical protein